jgi:protein SCO1/2
VTLINQDNVKVSIRKLLSSDMPVLVDFVYTTCTTICPVLSINFANFQKTIIEERGTTQLISISIDPEFDTPKAMKAYLKRYNAKSGWDFLTGSRADISRVLKAFKVYTLNKMNHYPVILLKSPTDRRWVRVYGLIGTSELLVEYEKVRK